MMKQLHALQMILTVALFVTSLSCLSIKAWAFEEEEGETIELAEAALPDETLAESRAGFMDTSGISYRFGVDVQTQVNGNVAFTRSLSLVSDGTGNMTASSRYWLIAKNLPSGTSASVVNGGQGISVVSPDGATTALNQTPGGSLANIIVNTASNRQISQTMTMNLTLRNVPSAALSGVGNTLTGLAQGTQLHGVGL
jgi:hypothetical protein